MKKDQSHRSLPRRHFISQSMASAAVLGAGGAMALGDDAKESSVVSTGEEHFVGEGEHRYKVINHWVELPDRYTWQTTHNVAVDQNDCLYVIHAGHEKSEPQPTIFVFDPQGKFMKAFGQEFHAGGHGLEIRQEGGEEFLYVTAIDKHKTVAKLTTDGETVWSQKAPMGSGLYPEDENTRTEFTDRDQYWGRNHFLPSNIAFHPDGGFYVADGYGTFAIHRYDQEAKYVSTFGKIGKEDGEFNISHGIWIDSRGEEPLVVIADRGNHRLQWFTLDGEHRKTMGDFILPANIDQFGKTLLVPELGSRITLLGPNDEVIRLGDDAEWRKEVSKDRKAMRKASPDQWQDGRFIHPHDACFDSQGNIFVAEWVYSGRVYRLEKQS